MHLPPFTALTIGLLYFAGKNAIPAENQKARGALIVALGVAAIGMFVLILL